MLVPALIVLFWGVVDYVYGYSRRFGLVFMRKRSRYHRDLGRISLALYGVVVGIAFALPPLTVISGRPLLAYLAATLTVASLFLYRLTLLSLRVRLAPAGGKRAKPIAEQERTRWPYAWTCGVGYLVLYAYACTILPAYR